MYVTTHSNPKENSKTRITSLSYIFVNRSIRENSPAIPTRGRAEPRRISHEAFDWTWRRMRAKRRMRVKPNLQDAVVSTRPRRRRRRRRHHLSLRVGSRSPTCESAQSPHRQATGKGTGPRRKSVRVRVRVVGLGLGRGIGFGLGFGTVNPKA